MKAASMSRPLAGKWVNTMVHQPDTSSDADGDKRREGGEHTGPEVHRAGDRDRQVEASLQPQHQQGGDDETAAERVEAEQRSQPIDDPSRLTQCAGRRGTHPFNGG